MLSFERNNVRFWARKWMFACNFEKLGSRKLRRLPQIADFKTRNRLRTRCDTAFVGIIVPSLWGGLGRGLTLLFFSGGHIGPHPTKRPQRTGHAHSLPQNSSDAIHCVPTTGLLNRHDVNLYPLFLPQNNRWRFCRLDKNVYICICIGGEILIHNKAFAIISRIAKRSLGNCFLE